MEKKKVCIVGGGAAGMIAAIMATRNHAAVTVLEHNEKQGKNCWQQETDAVISPMKNKKKSAITAKIRKFYGMFCKIFLLSRHWTFLRK